MELNEIGIRLLGTFFSLFMGGALWGFMEKEDFGKTTYYCTKLASLCLLIGGTLTSWFLKVP